MLISNTKNKILKIFGIKEKYFSAQRTLNNYALSLNNSYDYKDSISVIIPSLNRLNILKLTLKYLQNYRTQLNLQLIIVDNNSNIETKNYLKSIDGKGNIKVIFSDKNLGGAESRLLTLQNVTTEYVCFLDNDILVMTNFFESLLNTLKRHSDVSGVQSKVVFPNLKIQINSPDFEILDKWIIFKDLDSEKHFNDSTTLDQHIIKWMPIGATLWRTATFNIYKFDSEFGTSFEDNDLTYRMYKDGIKLMNCPSAVCMHLNSQFTPSSNDAEYLKGRYGNQEVLNAAKRFYLKHNHYFASGNPSGFAKSIGFESAEEYIAFLTQD